MLRLLSPIMKRIFVSLFFALSSSLFTYCKAQDYYVPSADHHHGHAHTWKDSLHRISFFYSFDLGVSVPLRDFGSRDTTHNFMIYGPDSTHGKGFANTGFHGSMSGGVFITPYMGLCAKIGYNENTFDETMLNLLVSGQYAYSINDNYSIWQFMGGVFGDFPLGKKSSVWVQGMVGLINVNFPSFSIYNLPQNIFPPYVSWNFSFPNASDLAYSVSITYEKPISTNVSLTVTGSYTGSDLMYPTLSYTLTGPYSGLPISHTQDTPVTMSFGSLDFSVGLLFHF